jgi:hypothetical protein
MARTRWLGSGVPGSLSPIELYSKTCGVALDGMQLGSNRGQHSRIAPRLDDGDPYEFSILGQVGQESNLQPAVLEHAALRPR